jgi:predicted ATPase/class 3 adenylate cyclase
VTFLFTDIEGSTRLWESHPDTMRRAVARHDELLRQAIARRDGHVFSTAGDGLAAAFARSADAVAVGVEVQHLFGAEPWPEETPIRVRMGLHTGEAEERDGDYFGSAPNRAARLTAIGHGGQFLCSQVTADLVRDALPSSVTLRDLGRHRLRDLSDAMQVFQVVHPDLPSQFPPLRSLDTLPGNLPRQITTFVGRTTEIERLSALVRERPLVTLTGVGGVGKTRLAVQVAADVAADFADGAWLCELGPVVDPGAVWEVLAATLGVAPVPGQSLDEVVLDYVAPKRLLVVLDNCEHLLGAVAGMVTTIAQRCPRVVVLATSREGLALAGEQLMAVPSLGVPAAGAARVELADAEAVRLFCDRAHDADDSFALNEGNAAAVAQLCRRLDGIPLAIELAAARVRSLSPEDLVARLDQRFKLLTRGGRAGLERHQTLRHTVDWSYELLTAAERVGLNRLAVFAGSCDLTAAEAVIGGGAERVDATELLGQLVDKSLVLVDHETPRTRYRLLETIRQYAQERLEQSGETAAVRGWHLDHYVALAEAAAPQLRSRDQLVWASTLMPDMENLRAALDYAVESALPDPALRLVAALSVAGLPLGVTVMGWADSARSIPGANTHELFPFVVAQTALDATLRGDLEAASRLVARAEEAQLALGTDHPSVHAAASALAYFRGDLDEARRYAKLRLEHAQSTGDNHELAHAYLQMAAALLDNPGRGAQAAEDAVRVARETGLISVLPYALGLYLNFVGAGDHDLELAVHEEIIAVATALGDHRLVALSVASRASAGSRQGDWRTTLRACASAAAQTRDWGNVTVVLPTIAAAAVALIGLERFEAGAVILGFAYAHYFYPSNEEHASYLAAAETALADALGEHRLTELRARGAALAFPDVIDYLSAEADRALAE